MGSRHRHHPRPCHHNSGRQADDARPHQGLRCRRPWRRNLPDSRETQSGSRQPGGGSAAHQRFRMRAFPYQRLSSHAGEPEADNSGRRHHAKDPGRTALLHLHRGQQARGHQGDARRAGRTRIREHGGAAPHEEIPAGRRKAAHPGGYAPRGRLRSAADQRGSRGAERHHRLRSV